MQLWKLRRRVHVSWVIALMCVGLVVGVLTSQYLPGFGAPWWLILALAGVVFVSWRRSVYLLSLALGAAILLGLWRGSVALEGLEVYEPLYGQAVVMTGSVADDPEVGKDGQRVIKLGRIIHGDRSLPGKVYVSAASDLEMHRSDIVTVQGKLSEGFGSYAGTLYRASIIRANPPDSPDTARVVRDWFATAVRTAIPEPQASLGIGYLVGQKSALPSDLEDALRIAGLTHIVVASGYNLTILVRLARRLFVKVSKYLSALSSSVMIACFMAVTGLSPSMSRAGLVAGLSLAAWYYGRRFHPLVLLPLAAAVTVLVEPSYVWGDLGWQLSFAAFAGVMIVGPLGQRYFFGEKKPGLVRQILGETIAAHIVTAPIILLAFGQLSNVAIFANLLVLPFVPLAMLLTFLTGVGALLMPAAAGVIGLPASWLLQYMTSVTYYLADLPWAVMEVEIGLPVAVLMYVAMIGLCVYGQRATRHDLRDSNIIE